jgi:hypothetical protein
MLRGWSEYRVGSNRGVIGLEVLPPVESEDHWYRVKCARPLAGGEQF